MKLVPLTQGKSAMIDEEDWEKVRGWKWRYHNQGYATGTRIEGIFQITVLMHRLIAEPQPGEIVDHRNHDRLDNQKANLCVGSQAMNMANRRHTKRPGFTSEFRGVARQNRRYNLRKPWGVQVRGKYVATAETEEEAAKLYDLAALREWGSTDPTEFPDCGIGGIAMSGLVKGVKKIFKKVAKVVKKIIKPVAIAVAAYFTAGLAMSYIPATQAFAASLPGFGVSAGGTATGMLLKTASAIGLDSGLIKGGATLAAKAGGAAASGAVTSMPSVFNAAAAGTGNAGIDTAISMGAGSVAAGSLPPAAAASMSLTDKLLLTKIGTDVAGALFGPTPQEMAEAEAIEAAKFRGSYYGMDASGATAPAAAPAAAQPVQQAQTPVPPSPEQRQLETGRQMKTELFPSASGRPATSTGQTTGPGQMQQQLTPPPGLFAPAENVRYV